ncbi:MAG TPA: hypothetical protein VGJ92_08565 [Methanocella sp.]|jgi:hypothetical protein
MSLTSFSLMASYNFPLGISRKDPNFSKILQIIKTFRGYETLEGLKAADEQVRMHLAQQLRKAAEESTEARKKLESDMHLRLLPDFDAMVRQIHSCKDRLQDRLQGKIAACKAYRPEADPIREAYNLDFKVLSDAENVFNLMQEFARMAREDMMLTNIHKIDLSLGDIAESMEKRESTIDCMLR